MKTPRLLTSLFIITLCFCSCDNKKTRPSGEPSIILTAELYDKAQLTYDDISLFEQGTAVVKMDFKYGLIASDGEEVMPCIYDSIYNIRNEVRIVRLNGKVGVVDMMGDFVVKCEYDNVFERYHNFIPLKRNNKWGLINKDGSVKIPFKYAHIQQLDDSIIVAQHNGFYGMIDYDENIIIDFKYDRVLHRLFYNTTTSFLELNNKVGIVNSVNKIVAECKYDGFAIPENGYLTLSKGKSSNYETARYGLVNCETGVEVIPFEYERLGNYSDGLIMAKKDGKYGYLDIENNISIPFLYAGAEDFSEGKALVYKNSGYVNVRYGTIQRKKCGYINTKGEIVIPIQFDDQSLGSDGSKFSEGMAAIGIGVNNIFAGKFGYIDTTGKFIIEPFFEKASAFKNGIAEVKVDDKIGFINKKGDFIIQCMYDDREYEEGLGDSIICLVKNDSNFYFDYQGRKKEINKH